MRGRRLFHHHHRSFAMATAKRTAVRGTATSVRKKSKPKPKGGPAPGTPSPMRTRLSAELQAHARRQFEETERPTTHIALDCGVDESVLRRLARREGWVRYVGPPLGLPPAAKLLAEAEALESSFSNVPPTPDPSPPLASLAGGGEHGPPVTPDERLAAIDRLHREAMAQLAEVEALRARTTPAAKDAERNAHTLSSLTETVRKLQGMRCALHVPGSTHDDTYDLPADPDEFRLDLARRIAAFMESRTDDEAADGAAAAAPDALRP
jgi:hypothetical protein